jgi:holo-[acyl-carrier protein] synthase
MTAVQKDMYTASMPLPPGEYAPPRDEMAESTAIVVGTDLVQVSEVGKAMERFGERYLRRLFTEAELSYCMESTAVAPSRLAARFAAKEAALKVLRLTDQSFSWRSIEVARNPGGWCYLVLHEPMRQVADQAGFVAFSLSMTHEGAYAQAVVVGQRRKTSGDDESKKPTIAS